MDEQQMFPPADRPFGDQMSQGGGDLRRPRRTYALLAWGIIVLAVVVITVAASRGRAAASGPSHDSIGVKMMQMQAQYMVFAAGMQADPALIIGQARALDAGSVDQRLRYVTLAGDLEGPQAALDALAAFRQDVAGEQDAADDFELTSDQQRVDALLEQLYAGRAEAERIVLDDADRRWLREQLGWFGELALTPEDLASTEARADVVEPGFWVFVILITVFVGAILAALAGLVGLVVMLVRALTGRLGGGLPRTTTAHGVYAETFAVWLALFFGLQLGIGRIASALHGDPMLFTLGGFALSLVALAWPVLRGVPWSQVRQDIGWHGGRSPLLEPLFGVAGYAMALPILALGLAGTLVLLFFTGAAGGDGGFAPTSGGAHPIVDQLSGPDWWPKILVLLVGSVAAPIVEETMFRGVLHRHLREATRGLETAGSVVFSALFGGVIFAVIHPQGLLAVPALTSLAFAFALAREWRGSLIAPMVMHGVSNGIVLSILIAVFAASGP